VHNELRRLRTEAGLTQETVAHLVGVSRRTIGSIERGEYVPSVTLALRLQHVLGVPVDRIFRLPNVDDDRISHPPAVRLPQAAPGKGTTTRRTYSTVD